MTGKKLSIAVLAVTMATVFCFPALSRAETDLQDVSGDAAKVEAHAVPANMTAEAKKADVSASYQKHDLVELFHEKKFTCSNPDITMSVNKLGGGLLITGKTEDLNNALFELAEDFDFDGANVSKICLDGLSKVKTKATAQLFMDKEEEPAVEIPLRMQKSIKSWAWDGNTTVDAAAKNLTGKHRVSFKFNSNSTAKNTSILLRSIEFMENDMLPTVYLNIDESIQTIANMNNDDDHNTECYGNMTLQIPAGFKGEYSDTVYDSLTSETFDMEYIRGRGNSTWGGDKKPYKIKLDKKADLLGMGANKHWVLLANRYDNSLLRNKITYWMGEKMGMEFTPQCEFVDVVMNGEYLGCYYLCEQIRVGDSRVEIDDLEDDGKKAKEKQDGIYATAEPQISGGYLLGLAPYWDDMEAYPEQMIKTSRGQTFEIESPEFENHSEEAKEAQYQYISSYIQKAEDAIYENLNTRGKDKTWEQYMDKDSLIKYFWFQEVSRNGDGYISTSSHMYKKRDGKLFMGPLWDFDYVAWGDLDYEEPPVNDGFMSTNSFWLPGLLADVDFLEEVKAAYAPFSAVMKEAQAQLDVYAEKIRKADFYEREKWGTFGEGRMEDEEEPHYATFDDEVRLLKNWMKTRDEWITENLDQLEAAVCTVTFRDGKKVVKSFCVPAESGFTDIPQPAKKKGKVFAGWFDQYGERLNPNQGVCGDMEFTAAWVNEADAIPVKRIYFQTGTMAMDVYTEGMMEEAGAYLPYTVVPFDATQQDLTWSCSDPSVLEINAVTGCMTPKKLGTAIVTAKAVNGKKASCKIVVRDGKTGYDSFVSLEDAYLETHEGGYGRVKIHVEGDPVSLMFGEFECSDPDVLDLRPTGVFQALRAGTATISFRDWMTEDVYTCTVNVKAREKKGNSVEQDGLEYVITKKWTKQAKAGYVKVNGFTDAQVKNLKIPASIKINGHTYKVVEVADHAFAGKNKIKSVTFGKNILLIGDKAFFQCKKLKHVNFTGKKIKKIGGKAFGKIVQDAVVTVPAAGEKYYRACLVKSAGITKTMKVRVRNVSYSKIKK